MHETPMLRQYRSIKDKHKDCILFFRLGDFYEMFYDDAKLASKTLDLVLTSRGKDPSGKIPMCGVPHHAADNYIARIIKAGYKVAICDQTEDPALAQGIVRRDVTRILSAGTFLDEHTSDSRILLCLNPNNTSLGIAFTDPATGTIQANQYPFDPTRLAELIAKWPVFECIYPETAGEKIKNLFRHPLLKSKNLSLTACDDWSFNPDIAKKSLCEHFRVHNLHGFGIENLSEAYSCAGALLEYLKQMNKQPLRHIDKIALYADDEYVFVSPAAHHGLELDTLIKTLDHTSTALGRRAFRFWLTHPLKDRDLILKRQMAVQWLKNHSPAAKDLKDLLNQIPDVEKNISRLSCGYTHAKDLLAIRNTIVLVPEIQTIIAEPQRENDLFALKDIPSLRQYLEAVLNEEIPLSQPEGNIVKKGYNAELDSLKDLQENGRQWLKKFQGEEIQRTRIHSLKAGFNQVFGYYIEVTKPNLPLVPANYIRKQTLVNAERFITPELKEFEEKILTAEGKILKIEGEIVSEIRQKILDHSREVHQLCQNIAALDVLCSLDVIAQWPDYIVPRIEDDTRLEIKDGRHPVVEKTLEASFVPNDTLLDADENHLIILTGPNMSGKSTYIRQTAILTIMAQTGSSIPAASAHIGIVDKIFTRIGAHDDISKGQSTFMVEMNETAEILNNMTENSLIVLDEIGRGTSTYDGLSLAWALAEYLQAKKARVLFATHFHELTALADQYSGVKNYNVAVKEWKDEIVFLHKIIPGSTDDSYGIYVAKLAGIPAAVINRAKHILTRLELKNDLKGNLKGDALKDHDPQMDMFAAAPDPVMEIIRETIHSMDLDTMTPLEAMNQMQELKNIVNHK